MYLVRGVNAVDIIILFAIDAVKYFHTYCYLYLYLYMNMGKQFINFNSNDNLQRIRELTIEQDVRPMHEILIVKGSKVKLQCNSGASTGRGLMKNDKVAVQYLEFDPVTVIKRHFLYEPEWVMVVSGKIFQETNGIITSAATGQSLFIQANVSHILYTVESSSAIFVTIPPSKDYPEMESLVEELDFRDKEIERQQIVFKRLFVSAPIGIALIDSLTGQICEANPLFCKITGKTLEELSCTNWMSFTHPDDIQEDLDNMAKMNSGKVDGFVMDKRYIHSNGSVARIHMTIAKMPVKNGQSPQHFCMVENIISEQTEDNRGK